jgi:hypothetical protein
MDRIHHPYELIFNEAVLAHMRDRLVRQTAVPPHALILRDARTPARTCRTLSARALLRMRTAIEA